MKGTRNYENSSKGDVQPSHQEAGTQLVVGPMEAIGPAMHPLLSKLVTGLGSVSTYRIGTTGENPESNDSEKLLNQCTQIEGLSNSE
jgi:hypothetical protein